MFTDHGRTDFQSRQRSDWFLLSLTPDPRRRTAKITALPSYHIQEMDLRRLVKISQRQFLSLRHFTDLSLSPRGILGLCETAASDDASPTEALHAINTLQVLVPNELCYSRILCPFFLDIRPFEACLCRPDSPLDNGLFSRYRLRAQPAKTHCASVGNVTRVYPLLAVYLFRFRQQT
ncbi:hypothetical protein JAAARDRAFT_491976 [Jaapia argillacea MUCL 33604]|uniref:Uncharacterized protein n=1 Tax=Jaapia argillacea MUCL 33604 TaxID=933084 RepID=A0A067PB36_9AGAM|nr:hypothetical protein JAAARDRAFT_491976 [Jaapia argillacea MUCL 33604]